MKKILFVILLFVGPVARAQQKSEPLNPGKGFWVVENNVKSPKKQMVKFYNSNLQLVYQEYYDRKQLNYAKKRVRSMLDSALVTFLKVKNESNQASTLANIIKYKY